MRKREALRRLVEAYDRTCGGSVDWTRGQTSICGTEGDMGHFHQAFRDARALLAAEPAPKHDAEEIARVIEACKRNPGVIVKVPAPSRGPDGADVAMWDARMLGAVRKVGRLFDREKWADFEMHDAIEEMTGCFEEYELATGARK